MCFLNVTVNMDKDAVALIDDPIAVTLLMQKQYTMNTQPSGRSSTNL